MASGQNGLLRGAAKVNVLDMVGAF